MRTKSLVLFALILGMINVDFALAGYGKAKLKDVSINRSSKGIYVDLKFNKKVSFKKIKPVYDRNFVQFSLNKTVMDKAKIVPIQTPSIEKVFAYPYTPSTVRVRVILNEKNSWAKGRISAWNKNKNEIRVFIKETKKSLPAGVSGVQKKTGKAPISEEEKLIKEVIDNTEDMDLSDPKSVKAALNLKKDNPESKEKIGVVANPSKYFVRVALVLFAILAFFGMGVFLFHRYSNKLKKLPFGKKERLIKVVATHYLGHKRSIALVKVANEYMVVGVGSDGISLISKLGSELNVDKYLEDRFWGGTFEKHLGSYAKGSADKPRAKEAPITPDIKVNSYDGVKDLNPKASSEVEMAEINDEPREPSIRDKIKNSVANLKTLS